MSNTMVTLYSELVKFIFVLQLRFTAPQQNHLVHMLHGIVLCEGRKNITQLQRAAKGYRHLSCMTKFFKHSPWSVNRVQKRRLQFLQERIRRERSKRGDPRSIIFLIIDDTCCKKDVSTQHMEGLDFHFAHDESKSTWAHCLVTAHVVAEGFSHAWDFRPYLREGYCQESKLLFKSKNDLAIELLDTYPANEDEVVYVLADSWYTSKKLMDACNAKGFHLIAAVKRNRKIAPAGIRISMSDFAAKYIRSSDLHSVTVEKQGQYRVYEYEGPVADMENVKVLLSWENGFVPTQKPFCILCTDHRLDLVTILRYYHVRWNIETGFRYLKELLGFDQYQLRSFYAIQRYWTLQYLVYNFLELQRKEWSQSDNPLTLGDVVRRIRNEHFGQIIVYVYQQALDHKPLKEVLNDLKLPA
jgi:SRSO17 transposase